ncbi:hypothetical protein V6N12_061855 [Hibiscus sabdariffa]|uniref:Uncharacterized protein n=1 Tax=Hibiscus sabdariffa TaxID=183260 RepID=A0ABR2DY95_9ROSI
MLRVLLTKGIPSPPLSDIRVDITTDESTLGVGGTAQRGLNGHGHAWDEDHTIVPLAVGSKAALGDNSGDGVILFSVGVTFMKNFELARFKGAIVESKEEWLARE